jgi:hypothetical protein
VTTAAPAGNRAFDESHDCAHRLGRLAQHQKKEGLIARYVSTVASRQRFLASSDHAPHPAQPPLDGSPVP